MEEEKTVPVGMVCAHSQIRQSITWWGNDGEAIHCLWVEVIGIRSISAHKSLTGTDVLTPSHASAQAGMYTQLGN